MPKKGSGWSYRDEKGTTRCRSCGRFKGCKPEPSCSQGHIEAYRKAHTPEARARGNRRVIQYSRELRSKALAQMGLTACQFCGRIDAQINLAHKAYWPDSAKPNATTLVRAREAIKHPERFYGLCYSCHRTYDSVKRETGFDILTLPRIRK